MALAKGMAKSKATKLATQTTIASPRTLTSSSYDFDNYENDESYGDNQLEQQFIHNQLVPSYGHLPICTVFTCDICDKSFSKADSLETHRKCHKSKIITLDPNLIKEGKVIIDGLNVNISPCIKLHKLDYPEALPRSAGKGERGYNSAGKCIDERYSNIRTYGSHIGTKGLRDTSSRESTKKQSIDMEITPPLPGESYFSQIRQQFPAASISMSKSQEVVSWSQELVTVSEDDSHISIGVANRHAGMKCTYASKSSNKPNKHQINTSRNTDTSIYDGNLTAFGKDEFGRKTGSKLDPIPKPTMSTPPISSTKPMALVKTNNLNGTPGKQSTEKSKTKSPNNINSDTASTKTSKKQSELINGEISTVKNKTPTVLKPKAENETHVKNTSQQKVPNVDKGNDNVDEEEDEDQPKEKSNIKMSEEIRQIVRQTNMIDLRDKHKYVSV